MPVVPPSPESELGRELAKWQKPPGWLGSEFPKMLYQANDRGDGVISVGEPDDENFSRRCQRIVRSEAEEHIALEQGWRATQAAALEAREARDKAIADVAAHRHYEDRNMSEKARVEAAAADDASAEHVPEVPEKPKSKQSEAMKRAWAARRAKAAQTPAA